MSAPKYLNIGNFFQVPVRLLFAVGIIVYPRVSFREHRFAQLNFFFAFLSLNFLIVLELIYDAIFFKHGGGSLMDFSLVSICVCFTLMADAKAYFLLKEIKRLNGLIAVFYDIFPATVRLQHLLEHYNLKLYYRLSLLLTSLVGAFILLTATGFACIPIVLYYQQTPEERANGTLHAFLPVPFWYPFEMTSWQRFIVPYLHQSYGFSCVDLVILGVDGLMNCILLQLCMHFDALESRLMKLDARETDVKSNELLEIIEQHELLLRQIDVVNDIFSKPVFITLGMAAAILCFVGFIVAEGVISLDYTKFVAFLLYELGSTYQMCLLGDKITTKSHNIAEGVYKSNWYEGNIAYQKTLQIVMVRSQKAANLDAFTFHGVSLDTFKQICSASYKFLALLRTINNP